MIRNFAVIFLAILATGFLNAQSNILNAKTVAQMNEERPALDNDRPIPYGYIDDRDVLWSKVVWEFIDLNQKINLPYYFPTDTTNVSSDRRSLWHTLYNAVKQGEIGAYDSDLFITTVTKADIEKKLFNTRGTGVFNDATGEEYKNTYAIATEDITGLMIKGIWYFDKRQGELKYRLLGIAPMGADVLTMGKKNINDEGFVKEFFWVFYPAAREILHEAKVFNPKNSMQPISFDHLLNARRFSSVIVKEENIYNNRKIEDYVRGNSLFQLLEADRIKESIRNREMDMWSY
jgi:gliding motility associated protien GldN